MKTTNNVSNMEPAGATHLMYPYTRIGYESQGDGTYKYTIDFVWPSGAKQVDTTDPIPETVEQFIEQGKIFTITMKDFISIKGHEPQRISLTSTEKPEAYKGVTVQVDCIENSEKNGSTIIRFEDAENYDIGTGSDG